MKHALLISALAAATVMSLKVQPASALDLYLTNDAYWFDSGDKTPVDAVIELTGLSVDAVTRLVRAQGPDFQKINIAAMADDRTDSAVKLSAKGVLHADLVKMRQLCETLKKYGAKPLGADLPLEPKVLNMNGQIDFVAAVSGMQKRTLKQLAAAEKRSEKTGKPVVFRYYLEVNPDQKDWAELKAAHGDAVVGHIPLNVVGQMPVAISGESIVFHARTFHSSNILGKRNPGLNNQIISEILTRNKYFEYRFWNEFVPGVMPETTLLHDFLQGADGKAINADALIAKLNKKYPEGWVIKGVNESNSNFKIITEKVDVAGELRNYESSDFETFRKEIEKKYAGADEDTVYEHLQQHPNYFGFRIKQYFSNPQNAIVQRKVQIEKEYRVDIISGRALKNGTTIDRYNWLLEAQGKPTVVSPPEVIEKIDNWSQSVIDRLPKELRALSAGFDAAFLKDGGVALIEANPGTESSSTYDEPRTVKTINDLLREFPARAAKGDVIATGLDPKQQMDFLQKMFKKWNIDPAIHFKGYTFYSDHISTKFAPVEVPAAYTLRGALALRAASPERAAEKQSARGSAPICRAAFGK